MNNNGPNVELLLGATFHFVPDGTTLATTPSVVLASNLAAPANAAFYDDWLLGCTQTAMHKTDPKKRPVECADPVTGVYRVREVVSNNRDYYELKTIDVPQKLYNMIAYGLATPPVADTPQVPFKVAQRGIKGWFRHYVVNEDGVKQVELIARGYLNLKEPAKFENKQADVDWTLEVIHDADQALTSYTHLPA
jgi:hypothetical protein